MIGRYLVALVLLVVTALAQAEPPPSHVAFARAALLKLPTSKRDRTPERLAVHAGNLETFAVELARVSESAPLPPKVWIALLATIGAHESAFDTEVVADRCAAWACDRGRARGAFQNHRVAFNAELWDVAPGNLAAQVTMADRALRRSLKRCEPFASYPAHIFRAYRGGSCSWPNRDEAARVATFNRLMLVSAPVGGAS